jgi:hypothetical protein
MLEPGGSLHWNPADPADRIVLFTERIETPCFLEQNLARDLKLEPEQIAVVHGTGIGDALREATRARLPPYTGTNS